MRFSALFLAVTFLLFLPSVDAQQSPSSSISTSAADLSKLDRVRLRPPGKPGDSGWYPPRVIEYSGTIEEFDQQRLILQLASGEVERLPSNQVEAVEVAWTEPAVIAALELMDNREYRAAVNALDAARQGLPTWKQRILIAQIVQAAAALDNPKTAGILFLNLAASKPPQMLYGAMPLCWTVRDVERPLAEAAVGWLKSKDETAQLLGASWLLFGTEAAEAKQVLVQLKSSKNPALAQLAIAQSWRLVPPPETLQNVESWFAFRDRMDTGLQLGPTEFLADRLQRVGELDLALGEWSRIASAPRGRYDRALRALRTAADNLQRGQRAQESEIIQRWIEQLEGT